VTAVVLLPTVIAIAVAYQRGFRDALIYVALPAMLLLPGYYYLELPGIPEANFWNFTLTAVFAALVFGSDRRLYRFHWFDLVVLAYILWTFNSEYYNKGFKDAQKLLSNQFMGILIPYVIGRVLATRNGLLVSFIAMIAILGAFIGFVSPYEARMGVNPFDFWRKFWPVWVGWDGALYRNGLRRVAGPFAHPICHGFFFSMTIPLILWLRDQKLLSGRLGRFVIPIGNFLGMATAGSRGPILGYIVGYAAMRIGWARARVAIAVGLIASTLVASVFLYDVVAGYVSVSRGKATTATQETAAYRKELLDNYLEVLDERPYVGFGRNRIPVIRGQWSIDNQYLFLALVHGYPAAYLFLACMLGPILLLFSYLMRIDPDHPIGRLAWAVLGSVLGAILTQVTVFAGTQTEQVLAILEGIAIGLVLRLRTEVREGRASVSGTSADTVAVGAPA